MRCPFCGASEDKVMETRVSRDGSEIRRRRECETCARRYTTYARIEESMPLVIKNDGRREPFDRAKIVGGLARACEKRPVPVDTIEAVTDQIERAVQEGGEKEVPSSRIGEAVMDALHELDAVAYVRFASVYRNFREAKDFEEFVGRLGDAD